MDERLLLMPSREAKDNLRLARVRLVDFLVVSLPALFVAVAVAVAATFKINEKCTKILPETWGVLRPG